MMKKKQLNILFIKPWSGSSFIINDELILKRHFQVRCINKKVEKYFILKVLKCFLKKEVDLVYIWFANSYFAPIILFCKLFRIKSIVIIGGYDVADEPDIIYGQFSLGGFTRLKAKFVLKNADILLPVSNYTKKLTLKKIKSNKLEVVYNGLDTKKFKPKGDKKNMILTIGRVTKQGIKLKGLDTFAKASIHFPDYKFVIISDYEKSALNDLKKINQNIIFAGYIPHSDIINWFQQAKIYCQLSYVESFGMSVAEAMSCKCIPIVTNRGALSELVGNDGFFTTYNDENSTIEAIRKAINSTNNIAKQARQRIVNKFDLEIREKRLIEIIKNLINNK